MTPFVWIVLAAALVWGVLWFLRRRGKQESDRQAGADKRAKSARDEAHSIQRTLDGRR